MIWVTSVSGYIKGRLAAPDYLEARGAAFERREHMDPAIRDFFGRDEHRDVELWLAFMAGSDWERTYHGRRYNDELTSAN
jgi:hypothetical protein